MLVICLSACQTKPISASPAFPEPGKNVPKELGDACLPSGVNKCPEFFNWLDELYKLKEKLDIARK